MGMNRQQKAAMVEEVSALVAGAQAIIVAEYRGLDVEAVTRLRKQARSQGVRLRVLKNTLARRAVNDTPFAGLAEKLVGPLMYGFSADPVAAAKVMAGFAKDNDKLVVKFVSVGGQLLGAGDIERLASLPTRDQALAMLLGVMKAPIEKLARTINEVPGKLVRTVAAIRDQKQAAA